MKKFLKLWLPCFVYFGIISYFSHYPTLLKSSDFSFLPNFDKFLHFCEYFFFGLLLSRACYGQHRLLRLKQRWFYCVLFLAIGFSALDEWHQSFVPERIASVFDAMFDVIGVVAASVFYLLAKTLKETKRSLHIDVVKQKKFIYRAYLILPVAILLIPKFYFSSQFFSFDLINQKDMLVFDIIFWAILGLFWSRFWMWEVWWHKQKVFFQILGIVLITAILFLDLYIQKNHFHLQKLLFCSLALFAFYFMYQFGFSIVKKSLKKVYKDPHSKCSEKH